MSKSKLKALKKPVDKDIVTLLEQAMAATLSGELTGIVVLTNQTGNTYQFGSAGDMKMSEVVNCFRAWEFDQRLMAAKESK